VSVTYDFILDLAQKHNSPPARLLDFGCGAGEVVAKALDRGFDAIGIDSFDDMWVQYADRAAELKGRIKAVPIGTPFPFSDEFFDIVVTNQVFEHVADPTFAIGELARVLRPGGTLVTIFPTREIIVEPHLKAPFVHWFTNGSARQMQVMNLCHSLGLCNRPEMNRDTWVAEEMKNLRTQMFYKTERAAIAMFAPQFRLEARAEAQFLRDRLSRSRRLAMLARMPASVDPILEFLCLRLANAVLVFRKVKAD
jgi:SAM-dependent methyltransferase